MVPEHQRDRLRVQVMLVQAIRLAEFPDITEKEFAPAVMPDFFSGQAGAGTGPDYFMHE